MCGIVGMAGNLNHAEGKMFRDMLIFDTVRGMDSTGVLHVPYAQNKALEIEKTIGPPSLLWEYMASTIFDFKGYLNSIPRAVIGHNRAATLGVVNDANAHPFEFGDIIGVHNGSLTDWRDLEGYSEYDVDSKALIRTIAEKGIKHTWKSFTGAAAVVWWDKSNQTLNIIRNSQRPLYMMWNEKKTAVFFASEPWMIRTAASRNNVKLEKNDKGAIEVPAYFEEDHLYTFDASGLDIKAPNKEKLEKKQVATTTTGGGNSSSVGFKTFNNRNGKKRGKQINTEWAKGRGRAGKETRGVKISLKYECTDGNRFMGEVVDGGDLVEIYPQHKEDGTKLREALNRNLKVFKTEARMREKSVEGKKVFAISSQHIKQVVTAVHTNVPRTPAKDDKSDDERFRSFNGERVTASEWSKRVRDIPGGGTCAWCGDPLLITDHEKHLWLSKQDVLCPCCAKDEDTLNQLSGIYNMRMQ